MIDRLELQVPENVPRRAENWLKLRTTLAKIGTPYALTSEADNWLSLRIHHSYRVPVAKDKKHVRIDFTRTRQLTAADLLWRLTTLFEISRERAFTFRIARIDFAADVRGVPVEWFRRNCYVKRKKKSRSYEVCEITTSKGATTSLLFGARPDIYRIYNKIVETRARSAEVLYEGMESGAPIPIVTRVERQCSGRAIPRKLATLGGLLEQGADIDPFPSLVCSETGGLSISSEDWAPQKWLMCTGLAAVVSEMGEATVRARLNRARNANRIFTQYSDLLRTDSVGVTKDRLREIYRKTTTRQLNLPFTEPDGKTRYPMGGFVLTL